MAEGSVTFQINGKPAGNPISLDALGRAQLSIAHLSVSGGPYAVTALYTGTAQFLPSTGSMSHTVEEAPLAVVADDQRKYYDGQPFTGLTVHFVGFANGQDVTSAGLTGARKLRWLGRHGR